MSENNDQTPIYDEVSKGETMHSWDADSAPEDQPEFEAVKDAPSFLARARKAVAGGVAGLATGGLGSAVTAALSDGVVTGAEAWQVAAFAIGGFFVGFGTVFAAPANANA